jgi:hypothetical protein
MPPAQLTNSAMLRHVAMSLALLFSGPGTSRAVAAARIFESFCLNKSFEYRDLDRRATNAGYTVVEDRTIPMPDGANMLQKNWLIPSSDGAPVMLISTDITRDTLRVLGCGVYDPDLNGHSVEAALTNLPRLGAPTNHLRQEDGGNLTWWLARVGEHPPSQDSKVMLSTDIPGMPGANVLLTWKLHPLVPKAPMRSALRKQT